MVRRSTDAFGPDGQSLNAGRNAVDDRIDPADVATWALDFYPLPNSLHDSSDIDRYNLRVLAHPTPSTMAPTPTNRPDPAFLVNLANQTASAQFIGRRSLAL